MTYTAQQTGFSAGELSPSLFGRTDLAKYKLGTSTCRNFYVNYRGGVSSRAGLAYVGMCKQGAPNLGGTSTNNSPRDIPFQFNINQGYALEFGDQYMRIKSQGAYVIEAGVSIVGATQANTAVIRTAVNHGYSIGDWVFIEDMEGMTNFDSLTWIINSVPSNITFTLTDLFGNVVDSTLFNAYTSGGIVSRIYTVVSPYAAIDLPYLKFTQSADTMTLCCVNQVTNTEYPSYELTRNGQANWVFAQDSFAATISPPTGTTGIAQSSTTLSTWYSYVVTAVNSVDGSESNASSVVNIQNNDINIYAGSNTISWNAVAGASSYNVYKATPSYNVPVASGALYGFIGSVPGTTFTDTNITSDFTQVPPVHNDPFAESAIIDVLPTSPGTGYTQNNIGYTINTSTGSGAILVPIVVNNGLSGFYIENGGKGYSPSDTITITGGGSATGFIAFQYWSNPAQNNTINFNGVTWTFVTAPLAQSNASLATGNLAQTLTSLVSNLNQSNTASISVATYSLQSTATGYNLVITYKTGGTSGNAYTISTGIGGASVSGATLTGGKASGGATATLTLGPATGTYPGTPAYYQQRRAYANSLNDPDTYWMSQPGAFSNMDSSIPLTDSDAIVGSPWAQQINGIQFMVPMPGGLVIFTGKQAWQLNGGSSAAITPADQTASPQSSNGCSSLVPPIPINYDILYVQSKNSIVRDLQYNFFVNIYTGNDMTVLSNQLFDNHTILQWAYAEEPNKIVWAIRDDGVLLSFTYLKEQDVYGWTRNDTNGLFQSICSVTETAGGTTYIDAVYSIVKRYIQGKWVYYSERMDNRQWLNTEDCFCVDAGLSYPMTFPAATLTAASAVGPGNISGSNVAYGGVNYTAPIITAIDPKGIGTGATFSATIVGGAITAITPLTQGSDYSYGTYFQIQDATGSGAVVWPVISNNVNFTASSSVFNSGMVGNVIRMGGGVATITSYSSGTQVIANISIPITATIPNDPTNTPVPAVSGSWSISVPTTTVSGLNHLEGLQVTGLADGAVIPLTTVQNGSITLSAAASAINVGLPYICQLQTLYLDSQDPAGGGSIQGRRKNIQNMVVRVQNTLGIVGGCDQPDASTQPNGATVPWTSMRPIEFRSNLIPPGIATPLYTGDKYVLIDGEWDERGQVAIQQSYPLPANLLSVFPNFSQGDNNG